VVKARGDGSSRKLKVHFDGFASEWDEWIAVSDGRLRPCEAEGFKLHFSTRKNNSTGYDGVHKQGRLFRAALMREGEKIELGSHATAVQAAVAVARHLKCYHPEESGFWASGGAGGRHWVPHHREKKAVAAAEEEEEEGEEAEAKQPLVTKAGGIELHMSSNSSTGYKGIRETQYGRSTPPVPGSHMYNYLAPRATQPPSLSRQVHSLQLQPLHGHITIRPSRRRWRTHATCTRVPATTMTRRRREGPSPRPKASSFT
jgi:hypothetical protein